MEALNRNKQRWRRSVVAVLGVVGLLCVAILLLANGAQRHNRATLSAGMEHDELAVVATVGMVGDVIENIVGEAATVETLIGSGVDPHLYTPTRNDTQKILEADVVFYVGLQLEGHMSTVFERADAAGRYVAFAELIGVTENAGEHSEYGVDPHLWMDVALWASAIDGVIEVLSQLRPAYAADFARNGLTYRQRLMELDRYVAEAIASIPERQRLLITAHDAFGYFGSGYNIALESIQGLSTESPANIATINRLASLIVEQEVEAIFVESSVSEKHVLSLIEGVEALGGTVAIGGELFSDAFGESGSYRGTYIGMLDHNATVIAMELGGDVPPRGFQGRL